MSATAYADERWKISSARYEEMIRSGLFDDGDRVELLEGEVVPMSPIGTWHFVVGVATQTLLRRSFDAQTWFVGGPLPLVIGDASQPEPDVAVLRVEETRLGKPKWAALVVEISDTTLRRDRRKAPLYAAARIPEYWIVNRPDDLLEVHRDPIAVPTSPTGFEYRSVQMLRRGESVQALQAAAPSTVDELLGDPATPE